jgi:hypothetical protein
MLNNDLVTWRCDDLLSTSRQSAGVACHITREKGRCMAHGTILHLLVLALECISMHVPLRWQSLCPACQCGCFSTCQQLLFATHGFVSCRSGCPCLAQAFYGCCMCTTCALLAARAAAAYLLALYSSLMYFWGQEPQQTVFCHSFCHCVLLQC